MSHYGIEGWFPECILCGCGNVGAVVCLNRQCHEQYIEGPREYTDEIFADDGLIEEDGHWWKCCRLCDTRIHADPFAFGSYALCVACWHQFAKLGQYPPITIGAVIQHHQKNS